MKRSSRQMNFSLLAAITFLLLLAACSSSWMPTDEEAVQLVKDHYLFFYGGKDVEVKVIERGSYDKECECYPIRFRIIFSSRSQSDRTFYFYKDGFSEGDLKSIYG